MKVAIIGGGISGLATGYFAKKLTKNASNFKFVIFEACNRVGGLIRTNIISDIAHSATTIELGPWTLRCNDIVVANLLNELQMSNSHAKLFTELNSSIFTRLFASAEDGKLWQASGWNVFRKYFVPDHFALCRNGLRLPKMHAGADNFIENASVAQYVEFLLGSKTKTHFCDAFINEVISPVTGGIFAAPANDLLLRMAFPQIYAFEKRRQKSLFGSILQEKFNAAIKPFKNALDLNVIPPTNEFYTVGKVYAAAGNEGLEKALVHRIESALLEKNPSCVSPIVDIRTRSFVTNLVAVRTQKSQPQIAVLCDKKSEIFDLVLATRLPPLFLRECRIDQLPYRTLTLHVFVCHVPPPLHSPSLSYGVLTSPYRRSPQKSPFLGAVFASAVYRQNGSFAVVTVGNEDCATDVTHISQHLKRMLKIKADVPLNCVDCFVVRDALPAYNAAYEAQLRSLQVVLQNRFSNCVRLVGQVKGEGVGVAACISSAFSTVSQLAKILPENSASNFI